MSRGRGETFAKRMFRHLPQWKLSRFCWGAANRGEDEFAWPLYNCKVGVKMRDMVPMSRLRAPLDEGMVVSVMGVSWIELLWRVEGVKDDISLWPMMIWSAVVLLYGCWWRIFDCFQLQRFDRQATKTNKQALPHLSPCTSMYIISVSWRWIASLSLWSSIFISGWAAWWNSKLDFRALSWMHQRGR